MLFLLLFLDIFIMWVLLTLFSKQDWADQKLKIVGILLAISIFGGWAARFCTPYVGPFPALGAYFLVGTICLWALADLEFKPAALSMGGYLVFRLIVAIVM